MTYKEAIERLKYINDFDGLCQKSHKALNIAIKALERLTDKPKLQPCVCGCKRPKRLYIKIEHIPAFLNEDEYQAVYRCPKCDRTSTPAKSQRGLVRAWNDMIQKETGDLE